ncbi:MAG TPA: CHAT domain-containing tetratricopeptide repeat protein [Pyrinomonadaceae bacterium]
MRGRTLNSEGVAPWAKRKGQRTVTEEFKIYGVRPAATPSELSHLIRPGYHGLPKLNPGLWDETLSAFFESMFTSPSQKRRLVQHFIYSVGMALILSLAGFTALAQSDQQVKEIEKQIADKNLEGVKVMVKGDYDGAIALISEALAISEKNFGADDPLTSLSLTNLGRAYINKGDYEPAKIAILRSIKIDEQSGFDVRKSLAESNRLLAVAYDYQSDYSRAQPLYEKSLTLSEAAFGPESREVALVLNNLANLYSEKADYAAAAQLAERSLAIRQKVFGPNHPLLIVALNNLASIYEWQNNLTRAEELFKQSLAIAEKAIPDSAGLAEVISNLGAFYRKTDPKQARALLERGLAMREKILGPDAEDVAGSLNNLALLDWQEGQPRKAEQELVRAVAILQKTLGPSHPEVQRVLANLALLYSGLGDTKRAVTLLTKEMDRSDHNLELMLATGSEEQKRLYMASLTDATSAMVSLHLKSAPNDPAAARMALTRILRRKGRVLDVMSGQLAAVEKSDTEGQALLARLTYTRTQLSSYALQGPENGDVDQYQTRLAMLQEQMQTLEKRITERVTAAAGNGSSVKIEDVQAQLPAEAALVEFVLYRPMTVTPTSPPKWETGRYAAYVLHRTGEPTWVDLGDAAQIDLAALRLRAAFRNPRRYDYAEWARAFDEQVMKPIRKLLGTSHQILIAPDGMLSLVPFAALQDETDHFLIENYSISYLTSGRDLLSNRSSVESREGAVIVANPSFTLTANVVESTSHFTGQRSADMSSRFEPLEGTASEAQQLSTVLPKSEVFAGANATESVLKSLTGPSVLHVATHGFFLNRQVTANGVTTPQSSSAAAYDTGVQIKENPLLRSGLALAGANQLNDGHGNDGILTALEAAGLDLHGTKLVVLSACETGIGEVQNGEGVYGLRRALVLAGSESELMSLWKVDDEATRDLMVEFYKGLMNGESRSAALREVQLKLLKTDRYEHPFFWAAFILSGDWGPIKIAK